MITAPPPCGAIEVIHDATHRLVEAAQPDGAEVDIPEAIVDLLEAHFQLREQVTDVDPAVVPADPAVPADEPALEVARIVERRERRAAGPRGGRGAAGPRGVTQGLVRALGVVAQPEAVEAPLSLGESQFDPMRHRANGGSTGRAS